MVKPPAISIRRLMPHRRTGSDASDNIEESSADEHDLQFRSQSYKQQSSQTWLPQKPKMPSSPMGMRKTHTMPRSPLPVTGGSGSFDSTDPFRPPTNRKAAAVLGLPQRNMPAPPRRPARPSNGHLGLDESIPPHSPRPFHRPESPLPPRSSRSESPRPHHLRSESPLPLFNLNDSRPASPRPSFSNEGRPESPMPFISLADAKMEQVSRRERELPPTPPQHQEDWSENVKQLIQETDQAFKAVGSALADAKLSSYSFDRTQTPTPPPLPSKELPPLPTQEVQEPIRSTSPSADVPIVVEPPMAMEDAPIVVEPALPSPTPTAATVTATTPTTPRKASTVETIASATSGTETKAEAIKPKPKPKTKTTKKPQKAKRNKGWPAMSQAMASRLGLSENVTDILTGQRFKRIEADEMLTSEQIKELKRIREEARKQANQLMKTRPSIDSERSVSMDQTQELAGDSLSIYELPAQHDSTESDDYEEDEYEDDEWEGKDRVESSPPSKFPPRGASRLAGAITSSEDKDEEDEEAEQEDEAWKQRQQVIEALMSEEDDENIYLKSTPYSMTSPCFKHGKITLSKAEVNKVTFTVDDTLDWTAFQMAILGGAGDLSGGLYEDDEDSEIDMVDDVGSWFDTFGFESFGELVMGDARSAARESAGSVSSESSVSTIDADADLPIPIGSESPTSFWHGSTEMSMNTTKFMRSSGMKRWSEATETGPKLSGHTRDGSLPTSPMMPLVVGGVMGVGVGDFDETVADGTVPMGYNLGHDLGDFLRWEAEQMCGSGFYGAPRA